MPEAGENHAIFRDSAVQRFEIAFDSCWKTLKEHLSVHYGIPVASPKKVFQEAFKQGLIADDAAWLDFTDLRNEIAQEYSEGLIESVFQVLPDMYEKMRDLSIALQK